MRLLKYEVQIPDKMLNTVQQMGSNITDF